LLQYQKVKVLLSPIGAQGFIFGRGNLQFSPAVIRKIGIENIIVVSTLSKLKATPVIRVDTGDQTLDEEFVRYEMILVVIGYRTSRVVKINSA
jgi:predicted polyphosphate/ATP-dependent NAD kinase